MANSDNDSKADMMKQKCGKVMIVGAGPGDPDLITVKGLRAVSLADVVVYDRLANKSLLEKVKTDCELIYVGKKAGEQSMSQDEINVLLVERSREGKCVCRLKGGDPFIFGRGGEECLYLAEHGVPFEIVPGVTAASGVSAYASIPLTHRGLASQVTFVTGHEDPEKEGTSIDWSSISSPGRTLVFYMGLSNLEHIVERLVEHGCDPESLSALVSNGTLPSQRTIIRPLKAIAEAAREESFQAPALLIIGDVVSLSEKIEWFERGPLLGKKILVTRARTQASELTSSLTQLGAEVIECPLIRIESLASSSEMRQAVRSAGGVDWLVFRSINAVDSFLGALEVEGIDVGSVADVRIAAIGPATSRRLKRAGFHVDVVPEGHVSESLLDSLLKTGEPIDKTFMLIQSDISRTVVADGLRGNGAIVKEVLAYRTHRVRDIQEEILRLLRENKIDLVTFTSSSTVTNFVECLPEGQRDEILRNVFGASIGPITSQTARSLNVGIVTEASRHDIEGLTLAIEEYFSELDISNDRDK